MAMRQADREARFMPTNAQILNPHIGFTTFQRFNGDKLNPVETRKWTEGFPIEYQGEPLTLHNEDHPDTTLAYFRVYWKFFEPEDGVYNFDMLEKALATADARGQKLMFRLAPYGSVENTDVPEWYRALGNEKARGFNDYYVPQNDLFYKRFPDAIRAIAERYDADPRLDSVDMALIGPWGEGAGTEDLSVARRNLLIDAYTESFEMTPLMGFVASPDAVLYANRARPVGFRADCLGDMGDWMHMIEVYPNAIAQMSELWRKAPVSFEVCWVMHHWLDMGWDVDYIIEQSLKWHISSFNAKSSAVPKVWEPQVDEWLKKMGYRYALRTLKYPGAGEPGDRLKLHMWMENRGVAPCYYEYPLAIRFKGEYDSRLVLIDADCRQWLPGDTIWHGDIELPEDMRPGDYKLQAALIDPNTGLPGIVMPIKAEVDEGFTELGGFTVL